MEKHFVTYQQEVALKELGFDEPCFGVFYLIPETKKWESYRTMNESNSNNSNFAISRPLKSQVFEFFRDKHNLFYTIETNCSQLSFDWGFDYTIFDKENDKWLSTEPQNGPPGETTYNTYEEAESACIDKLIKIVKNDK